MMALGMNQEAREALERFTRALEALAGEVKALRVELENARQEAAVRGAGGPGAL